MEKVKKILKGTVKFAVVVGLILVAVLVVCGLPLDEIMKSLKSKLENF